MPNRLFSTIFLGLLINTATFAQTPADQRILDRVYQTYRTAQTYRDSGIVTTRVTQKPEKKADEGIIKSWVRKATDCFPHYTGHTSVLRFGTAYIRRTGQFRFNYVDTKTEYKGVGKLMMPEDRYTIVSNGAVTKTWWTIRPNDKGVVSESLTEALATATGVSKTSSRKIPGLLLAEPIGAGWDIRGVKDWQRISDGKEAGRDCYRFKGTGYTKFKSTLYIDKATFVVLRIDELYDDPSTTVYTVMQYKPVLNQTIASSALAMKGL